MAHTDIVKARAIRRAGHACEVCGTPVRFKSARLLEVKPLFGSLFDPEECCVLCERCWQDIQAERREGTPIATEILDEMQRTLDAVEGIQAEQEGEDDDHVVMRGPWGEGPAQRSGETQSSTPPAREDRRRQARREEAMRAAREAWFPPGDDDPDGGRCA